jgi:hypothetical protein
MKKTREQLEKQLLKWTKAAFKQRIRRRGFKSGKTYAEHCRKSGVDNCGSESREGLRMIELCAELWG